MTRFPNFRWICSRVHWISSNKSKSTWIFCGFLRILNRHIDLWGLLHSSKKSRNSNCVVVWFHGINSKISPIFGAILDSLQAKPRNLPHYKCNIDTIFGFKYHFVHFGNPLNFLSVRTNFFSLSIFFSNFAKCKSMNISCIILYSGRIFFVDSVVSFHNWDLLLFSYKFDLTFSSFYFVFELNRNWNLSICNKYWGPVF